LKSTLIFPGAVFILVAVALLVPAFFTLTWVISGYHRLSALRKAYLQAYGPLDKELKHHYELILALVEIAKGCLGQDLGPPEAILAARNAALAASLEAARRPGDAPATRDLAGAEAALGGTVGRLFALAKAHPELNQDQAMLRLRAKLEACDRSIAAATETYNAAVMRYNSVRGSFPNNLVAVPFGFSSAEPFRARNAPATVAGGLGLHAHPVE
jgi:LemA protein